jgi:hypothetical protein
MFNYVQSYNTYHHTKTGPLRHTNRYMYHKALKSQQTQCHAYNQGTHPNLVRSRRTKQRQVSPRIVNIIPLESPTTLANSCAATTKGYLFLGHARMLPRPFLNINA